MDSKENKSISVSSGLASTRLLEDLRNIIDNARHHTYSAINQTMVEAYWKMGKRIVEEEQNGNVRAEYGKQLLKKLSQALTQEYGKGFSVNQLYYIRQFYITFKGIFPTACGILTWSHYKRLLSVENEEARNWYLKESAEQMWSYATLNRNISTMYYERLLMSQQKAPVEHEMKMLTKDFDNDKLEFIKNPMVTEFLGIGPAKSYLESELEKSILNKDVVKADGKHFLVCTISEGRNKPYKNLQGEIWVRQGADKRRITENAEILALFQDSGSYQADAVGVNEATFDDLDRYAIDDYLQKVYNTTFDGFGSKAEQVLRNIHVLNHNGIPTLAGYLFFGKHPEYNCPTLMVKAVSFFGNELAGTQYRDTKEILGNMPQVYDKSMAFLKANLHNVQEPGASFNTLGKLEIAEDVLEEVLQNALVHRDLLRPAPIRIFIFDNRVEIISPGALAGGLTVDDIRSGKTYQRNPYMATFATNALYYRGIGSGIVRILTENPSIELDNDVEGKEFKVTIWRTTQKKEHDTQKQRESTQKAGENAFNSTQKQGESTLKIEDNASDNTQKQKESTQKRIVAILQESPKTSRKELATLVGITEDGIKKQLEKLKKEGIIERIGPDRGGYWKVCITKEQADGAEQTK